MGALSYRIDRDESATVVRLRGELLLRDVPTVRGVLLKCLADCPTAVVVDLAELIVRRSILLTVFPAVHQRVAAWPAVPLLLAAADGETAEHLGRMAMHAAVPVYATVAAAVAAAGRPNPRGRRQLRLRPTTAASAQARAFVQDACADWQLDHVSEAAALIVTELAENAATHARTDFTVMVTARAEFLHVSVEDLAAHPARLHSPEDPFSLREPGGRGLRLVDAFAAGWGTLPTFTGKTTWATIRTV